jgi:hypothetical protein
MDAEKSIGGLPPDGSMKGVFAKFPSWIWLTRPKWFLSAEVQNPLNWDVSQNLTESPTNENT